MGDCCHKFESLLFEPEGELSTEDRACLSEHIAECQHCRDERKLFLESWLALEELGVDNTEPTPCVRANVWAQIRKEEDLGPPPLLAPHLLKSGRLHLQRGMVAALALLLGFGMGRALKAESTTPEPLSAASSQERSHQDFLDPDLIELASQEGYSMEIFPESSEFSPIDREMMSALAPTAEDRTWVQQRRGAVVPIQYISQERPAP